MTFEKYWNIGPRLPSPAAMAAKEAIRFGWDSAEKYSSLLHLAPMFEAFLKESPVAAAAFQAYWNTQFENAVPIDEVMKEMERRDETNTREMWLTCATDEELEREINKRKRNAQKIPDGLDRTEAEVAQMIEQANRS